MDRHNDAVSIIASDVRRFYELKKPFRIYHGSTNSTRQSQFRRDATIDTTQLSHVLKVDGSTKTALVEPNVSMDRLVEATLQYSLLPPVVMEFPGITAGGGFAGTSGESSSFRHGLFDRTVNWIEIVLADGDIVTASNTDKRDLFHGAASSFGTLGVTTLLELQLIDAKTYVELTYHPVYSMSEAVKKIEEATDDLSIAYLDGILFARDYGVVCTGRLTNVVENGVKTQRFSRATDPWFYLHAKRITNNKHVTPHREAIPVVDYLFRYDRGAFWVGMYAFKYFVTPFNRITRWALNMFMHTRVMYHALHQSGHSKRYILQDVAVPYPTANEFAEYLDDTFKLYPLWLCPLRQTGRSQQSPYGLLAEKADPTAPAMLLNFGVWGPGPSGIDEFVHANRSLEQKVQELNGQKWLYAHTYYTEDEFWHIYDRKEYDALRAKYNAGYLPSVYDKVRIDVAAEKKAIRESWTLWLLAVFWSIWPLSGLYGVLRAMIGGDYLLPRKSAWTQEPKLDD
jgi:delta24-sterol reductase